MCDCKSNRHTTKLFSYGDPLYDQGVIYTHKCCVCNEKIALEQRHQVDDGARFKPSAYPRLLKQLRKLVSPLEPCPQDHIIKRARGEKKNLLLQAKASLDLDPVDTRDGKVKMFLKDDKYPDTEDLCDLLGQPDDYKITPPRCIQYRNKRYCLQLATYMHPMEEMLYAKVDHLDTPYFAKSRNLMQRGEDLHNKWSGFSRPVAYLLDHSKYDAHVNPFLKRAEDQHTLWCYNSSPELRELLAMQMNNKGSTKNGTKYRTVATRMSGDQNTGVDNSKGNFAMICDVFDSFGVPYSVYIDGDDSVVITEGEVPIDLKRFQEFGMNTKLDVVKDFQDIDFCQCKPVYDGVGWRMVRNPLRTLARTPWTVKDLTVKQIPVYLASIGDCEVALGMGLPIGQFIGSKLAAMSKRRMHVDLQFQANKEFLRPGKAHLVEPSMECRLSYERAWGISVEQQMHIESLKLCPPVIRDYRIEEFPYMQ